MEAFNLKNDDIMAQIYIIDMNENVHIFTYKKYRSHCTQ